MSYAHILPTTNQTNKQKKTPLNQKTCFYLFSIESNFITSQNFQGSSEKNSDWTWFLKKVNYFTSTFMSHQPTLSGPISKMYCYILTEKRNKEYSVLWYINTLVLFQSYAQCATDETGLKRFHKEVSRNRATVDFESQICLTSTYARILLQDFI